MPRSGVGVGDGSEGRMQEAAARIRSSQAARFMPASYQATFRQRSAASAAITTKKQRLMNDSRMNAL